MNAYQFDGNNTQAGAKRSAADPDRDVLLSCWTQCSWVAGCFILVVVAIRGYPDLVIGEPIYEPLLVSDPVRPNPWKPCWSASLVRLDLRQVGTCR